LPLIIKFPKGNPVDYIEEIILTFRVERSFYEENIYFNNIFVALYANKIFIYGTF